MILAGCISQPKPMHNKQFFYIKQNYFQPTANLNISKQSNFLFPGFDLSAVKHKHTHTHTHRQTQITDQNVTKLSTNGAKINITAAIANPGYLNSITNFKPTNESLCVFFLFVFVFFCLSFIVCFYDNSQRTPKKQT